MKLPFFNFVLFAWAAADFDYRTWQKLFYTFLFLFYQSDCYVHENAGNV